MCWTENQTNARLWIAKSKGLGFLSYMSSVNSPSDPEHCVKYILTSWMPKHCSGAHKWWMFQNKLPPPFRFRRDFTSKPVNWRCCCVAPAGSRVSGWASRNPSRPTTVKNLTVFHLSVITVKVAWMSWIHIRTPRDDDGRRALWIIVQASY